MFSSDKTERRAQIAEIKQCLNENYQLPLVIVRGAGDLATGVIQALSRSGFPVLALEVENPSAIRRTVAISEAVYQAKVKVEDVIGVLATKPKEIVTILKEGFVPVIADSKGEAIPYLTPSIVVDAILAKKNLGTYKKMASLVIALGPGFQAPKDAHIVIETMRGHDLGRLITSGFAKANTGIPGAIMGRKEERVLRAPVAGRLIAFREIGDLVEAGDIIAMIETEDLQRVAIKAPFAGLLRGLLPMGYPVVENFKIGDIDPRQAERQNCFTISEKARALGGATLQAIFLERQRWQK